MPSGSPRGGVIGRWRRVRRGYKLLSSGLTFAGAVLGLLLGLGIAKPFGSDPGALAIAAEKTRAAGSAFVDLDRRLQGSRGVSRQIGEGAFAFRSGAAVLDVRDEAGTANLAEPAVRYVFAGPSVYAFGLPNTKGHWCEFHLQSSGRLFGAITGFSDDPSQALVNVREHGHADEVGSDVVLGLKTRHYRGRVSLRDLARDATPTVAVRLKAFIASSGPTLPIEVWLSKDDLVRRIRTRFEAATPLGSQTTITLTIEFSRYGIEVAADKPPPEHTAYAGTKGCPETLE